MRALKLRRSRLTLDVGADVGGDARGQALVEFALVVSLFFFVLFSVIQLALVFGAQNGVVSAARETARYASTYRVAADVDAINTCPIAKAYLKTSLSRLVLGYSAAQVSQAGATTITYAWSQNHDGPNNSLGSWYVEVTVAVNAYRYPLYVPLISAIVDRWDGSIDNPPAAALSAHETMRVENPPLGGPGYSPQSC